MALLPDLWSLVIGNLFQRCDRLIPSSRAVHLFVLLGRSFLQHGGRVGPRKTTKRCAAYGGACLVGHLCVCLPHTVQAMLPGSQGCRIHGYPCGAIRGRPCHQCWSHPAPVMPAGISYGPVMARQAEADMASRSHTVMSACGPGQDQ